MDAGCPSCGAPVTAMKNGEPSICLNCGSVIRATKDATGVELCNSPPSFEDTGFFGGDIFSGTNLFGDNMDLNSMNERSNPDERKKKAQRENTVIDIDFDED